MAMQFLPALTRDPKTVQNETSAGEHLPYARHIDDVTIETRDGLLIQTIRLGGLLFETADTDELNYRANLRDAMLRTLGSSRFAVYQHVIRRPAPASRKRVETDEFSTKLDERWQAKLADKQLFVNELFLTIVRRPLQGRIGLADRLRGWVARSAKRNEGLMAAEKHALDRAREAIMASLSAYNPSLLSDSASPCS